MPDVHTPNEAVVADEPPISMSDAEVERLLDEATTLSQEIAEETGEALNEPSREESGDREAIVAQPADVAEPEPTTAPPPAAEQAKPLPDLLQDPDAAPTETATEAEQEPAANEEAPPQASDPPETPKRSEKIETRDEADARKASPDAAEEESSTTEDAQEEEPPNAPSAKEKLATICRLTVKLIRAVPIVVANGFMMIFVVLDRPFRNVSPGLKWVLGMIGLATLLAGIAAWILPDMMNQNPFVEMERYTKSRGG